MQTFTKTTRTKGIETEALACQYLQAKGLRLLTQNYQCKLGEIDLICHDGTSIVFVEVRFRSSVLYGHPAESVTRHKQRKLIKTARYFLYKHPQFANQPCRFDVIAITLKSSDPQIEWIQNAFY